MSNTKFEQHGAIATYWEQQALDARRALDSANAKNDLLRKQNAEMANALQELLCGVLHGFQRHNESDCIEMARAALDIAGKTLNALNQELPA